MKNTRVTLGIAGFALTWFTVTSAGAQVDTTGRRTSDVRIPVSKEGAQVTRRESGGEVLMPGAAARIDSLEHLANSYQRQIDSLEAANAALASRSDAMDKTIAALNDSLHAVRDDLASTRSELNSLSARTAALADSVQRLNQFWTRFRNGSLFGNSGFYAGVGLGNNYGTGTLRDLGYSDGINVTIPIGWNKRGNLFGIRTEWSYQKLQSRPRGTFANVDPKIYSAIAMAALHFPINSAKSSNIYVMGGGGVYHFGHYTDGALGQAFADAGQTETEHVRTTKLGLTAGGGLELHILGATSLFAQTEFTSVSADNPVVAGETSGSKLHWVPVVIGLQIR